MINSDYKEFGIVIIESLRDGDKNTGTILHNHLITYKKFQEPNLSSYLYSVITKKELFDTFSIIIEKIKTDKLLPILHIETHGFDNGLQLKSNEIVEWKELNEYLREINVLLSNSLLIMLSMCKGISIISIAELQKRAPFRVVIGSSDNINPNDLLRGYEAFYDNFFFSFDPLTSLDAMNSELGRKIPVFHLMTAKEIFDKVTDPNLNPISYRKQIEFFTRLEKETNPTMKDKPLKEIRNEVEKFFEFIIEDAKKHRDYFLLNDLTKE